MPHFQDDKAQETHRKENIVGSGIKIDSSSSRTEELPIQVATPNFLGASDPAVAMANKIKVAVVDSSFDSVEQNHSETLSSLSSHRIVKSVITPSSSIGNIDSNSSSDDISAIEVELMSSRKDNAGPIFTTVCGNSGLSHSPILVKRLVSQTEGEENSATSRQQQNPNVIRESTYFKYGESPSTVECSRPAKIRRGSSLLLPKQIAGVEPREEELSKTKSKKAKCEDIIRTSGDGIISGSDTVGKTSTLDSVAAAATIADMRNRKSVISPATSGKKGEDAPNKTRQSPPVGHHPHHSQHQSFHPSVVAPPGFRPHPTSFAGHPFGPTGVYHMTYPGYPPHAPPGAVPPFLGGQFHGHPGAGFYALYPTGFHPHPMHQRSGQYVPNFVPPYSHATSSHLPGAKISPNNSGGEKNNQTAVIPPMYMRSNSALDQSLNSATNSKSGVSGKPISANRCVPLQEPIPTKHRG